MTVYVYERLGSDRSHERRLALPSLGDVEVTQLFAGGWSSEAMVLAVAEAGGSRRLDVGHAFASRIQLVEPGRTDADRSGSSVPLATSRRAGR